MTQLRVPSRLLPGLCALVMLIVLGLLSGQAALASLPEGTSPPAEIGNLPAAAAPAGMDVGPMFDYSHVSKAKLGDVETTGTVRIWIGVADGLPHKQVVDGEAMGYKSTTTQYMTHDPTIKIEAPM